MSLKPGQSTTGEKIVSPTAGGTAANLSGDPNVNPMGGGTFAANQAFNPNQQQALADNLRPQNWTPQQEQGVGVWNQYTPEQQTQFMQGMTDYYQTGAGQGDFQEDQKASTEYWNGFPQTEAPPPPVEPPPPVVEDDTVDTTGGNGRQNNDGTYTRPTNPWSPPPPQQPQTVYPNRPQDYNSMSDWQKWQVDNRPMGATSELERPDDVALGGQQQDLDYNDPYTVSAQQGQQPLGSLYHPWQSYEGVQGAGGNYGGAGGQQYQQGYNPAIPQYYDQINNQYRQDLGRNVDNRGHQFYDNEFQMGMDQGRLGDILRDSDEWRGNQPQAPNPRTYGTPEFNQAITGMLQNFGVDENNYESFTPLLEGYYGSTGNPTQQGFAQYIMQQQGGGGPDTTPNTIGGDNTYNPAGNDPISGGGYGGPLQSSGGQWSPVGGGGNGNWMGVPNQSFGQMLKGLFENFNFTGGFGGIGAQFDPEKKKIR